ncbi:hypothetical protein [Streptomyces monomycini]|uniref:hypothetical protein n=1 Tax=Streptomyces monomycini TaxID=371720 RepID=UPI00067D7B07|nr:hypothetical protein [Streptomyces monomycini]
MTFPLLPASMRVEQIMLLLSPQRRWHPSCDGGYLSLEIARRANVDRTVAQLQAKGRVPRVCFYALSVGSQEPRHSLEASEAFALRQSWQVGGGQSYTDRHSATSPVTRPGWCEVRHQVRAGYADGVVVVTASVISTRFEEYRREIEWFGEHLGFIDLVVPDVPKAEA